MPQPSEVKGEQKMISSISNTKVTAGMLHPVHAISQQQEENIDQMEFTKLNDFNDLRFAHSFFFVLEYTRYRR